MTRDSIETDSSNTNQETLIVSYETKQQKIHKYFLGDNNFSFLTD